MERQEEHLLFVLRERLGDEIVFQKTLKWLKEDRTVLAGSFPLWFVFNSSTPRLWHKTTKKEIYLLYWYSKQLNCTLPQPALAKIGHLLQVGSFYDEFPNIDLDFFSVRYNLNVVGLGGILLSRAEFDNSFPASLQSQHGQYALLPGVEEHVKYVTNSGAEIDELRIDFTAEMTHPLNRWIDDYFDFDFCKVYFNGQQVRPLCQEMRGKANLEKYEAMFENIQREAIDRKKTFTNIRPLSVIEQQHAQGQNPIITAGGWHVIAFQLARSMEQRLEKYNRRRFTIENESDYKVLINRINLWAIGGTE